MIVIQIVISFFLFFADIIFKYIENKYNSKIGWSPVYFFVKKGQNVILGKIGASKYRNPEIKIINTVLFIKTSC